jgi:Na+-translocating ferredoxin:NAD+ oxidoreductase RnfD subunit
VEFLITFILVVGEWRYGILGGYDRLAAALGSALLAELALSWIVHGSPRSLLSAYITGISVAILVKPQSSLLWPFLLGGFLSIASKYVLRLRDRHLWNPSNFGIGVLLLLAAGNVAILSEQWGNALGTNAVIWAFGLLIVTRVGMLHVTATYVLSFLALAAVRSTFLDVPFVAEAAPLTGPMYQLFVFFMLTDPRTTVSTRRGRIAVAASVAVVEAGIRIAGDLGVTFLGPLYYSPPILALFFVGPAAMAAERMGASGAPEGAAARPGGTT